MSTFPPDRTKGVFAVSAQAVIDAPRERVWSVLTDFASYHEWYDGTKKNSLDFEELTFVYRNPFV
jgi:uncharacterized protein YndB with AHSA1/START domain